MRTNLTPRSHDKERGVVLVVALIFLMLMTLIGVTAIQTTSLEERMAGNHHDRNLAFQAAEAALRGGEDFVTSSSAATLNSVLLDEPPDPYDDNWDHEQTYTKNDLAGVSTDPVYVIEELADLSDVSELGDSSGLYRVTARGYGGTATAIVVLQSVIRRSD